MDVFDAGHQVTQNKEIGTPTYSQRNSNHITREGSWGMPIPPLPTQGGPKDAIDDSETFEDIDLAADGDASVVTDGIDPWNTVENITELGLSFGADEERVHLPLSMERFHLDGSEAEHASSNQLLLPFRPFGKWMKTLQRRSNYEKGALCVNDVDVISLGQGNDREAGEGVVHKHKKSSSSSSLGFVTAVKSASISLASFSIAPHSRRTVISSRHQRTDRGSKTSNTAFRLSDDSSYLVRGAVNDEAVTKRAIRRRQILEEIISTEESYVADIRFLMNVYVTLLASIPTLSLSLRSSINRNLNEIVELHEEILGDLHRVVPHSEYTQADYTRQPANGMVRGHHRWQSLDAVPERTENLAWLQRIPGMTADPSAAAKVAMVFGQKMHRFFAYEEYGAKYELMVKDVASTYRTIPQWEVYQRGLEALAASLASINCQNEHTRKSMTVGDLLVKPIQRVCKYPLLFSELLKQTPVCDCPDSHLKIEKVLVRLRETTAEINRSTDDPRMKAKMEKTWILQDRLFFPEQINSHLENVMRALGHIHLCGVLHVTWQTRDGVDGQYMISLLYRDYLILATATKFDQRYAIQASIALNEARVEEADNGRGLQCHTAPHSWKLVFECDHQLYELILSSCSPKEELEWRSRLTERACSEQSDAFDQNFFTSLSLGIKPMGAVFGKPGTVARRISIHRATTVGPKSSLCQVIIKNTSALKENTHTPTTTINRSQSLLSTNRIPVLAPSRAERARLESLISDIWSRAILPFPGMTGRVRGENLVRASASSMMRKLSVASIASNFTKRSGSLASLTSTHRPAETDGEHDHQNNKNSSVEWWDSSAPENNAKSELDEASKSKLSAIQDAAPSSEEKPQILTNPTNGCSPVGTMKRLATLRATTGSQCNGPRNITPPLRTSSANSMRNTRTLSVSTSPFEGSENQCQPKHGKRAKAAGLGRGLSADGIMGFFR